MKAKIVIDKDKELEVNCDTCKNSEFENGLVNEEEVKIHHDWNGDHRDGVDRNEVVKLVCKVCGRIHYFQDEYIVDANCNRIKLED